MRRKTRPSFLLLSIFTLLLASITVGNASARGEAEIVLKHPDGAPAWIVGELGAVEIPREPYDGSDAYFEALYGAIEPAVKALAGEHLEAQGKEVYLLDSSQVDDSQIAHLSFRQSLWDLPVTGSGFRLRVDLEDGRILAFNGRLHPWSEESDPESQELMAFEDAFERALSAMELPGEAIEPESMVFLGTGSSPQLAYQVKALLDPQVGPEFLSIDAVRGTLLWSEPTLLPNVPPDTPGDSPKTYPGKKQKIRTYTGYAHLATPPYDYLKICDSTLAFPIPGFLFAPQFPCAVDLSVSRAHEWSMKVFEYYRTEHGRSSFDGAYAPLEAVAHYLAQDQYGNWGPVANAFWDSQANRMYYGDGDIDGRVLIDLTLGFDVGAHEITHGVTQETSNLIYAKEPGALNEAMSDIFAAAAESWKDGGISADTWMIGEDVVGSSLGAALRYMNDPTLDGFSRDYYPEKVFPDPCTPQSGNDYCGVHRNSGIANLAFYLLVQGGQHPQGKTTTQVQGIGMSKAAAVFFGAQFLLNPTDGFLAIRQATEQVAAGILTASEAASVSDCWTAVGVVP